MAQSIVWRTNAASEDYEAARVRRIFNCHHPERYPRAIVFAENETEVLKAVQLARSLDCKISVRSGGHSWPVWSVQDDTILVDLENHKQISLEEDSGIALISPSTTSIELHQHLSSRGRIFSAGHCPGVGVGGALLCGGMGWNCNNWGFACEQVIAIDAVTTSGELIRADAEQNSDLFWAARGAGPFFPAIITRFYVQTRPAPRCIRSSGYMYPMSMYRAAFTWILEIASTFDGLVEGVTLGHYPINMSTPCIMIALVALGDDGRSIETTFERIDRSHPTGAICRWYNEDTTLDQEFMNQARAYPPMSRYCVDCVFLKNDCDVVEVLEPAFTTLPSENSMILWSSMIPRSRLPLPDMALSVQSDHYVSIYGASESERDYRKAQSWIHGIMKDVEKYTVGAYLGESDLPAEKQAKFWGREQGKRLSEVRKRWDPDGRMFGSLRLDYRDSK